MKTVTVNVTMFSHCTMTMWYSVFSTIFHDIALYCVHTVCLSREGLVSREEITAYFMRASVICSKLGLGFVHNFQETTYMKPTFCDNCSGFVSRHTNSRMKAYDGNMFYHFVSVDNHSCEGFLFLHVLHHSCGVSSSKATDAKVIIALYSMLCNLSMSIFCQMSGAHSVLLESR